MLIWVLAWVLIWKVLHCIQDLYVYKMDTELSHSKTLASIRTSSIYASKLFLIAVPLVLVVSWPEQAGQDARCRSPSQDILVHC